MTMTATYEIHNVRAIQAQSKADEKTGKRSIVGVTINDRPVHASNRFWSSLFSKYGFGKNMFNYFSPEEVFNRIADTRADDRIRFCLTESEGANMPTLMAVSNPAKPVLSYDRIHDLLEGYEPMDGIKYADGRIRASFKPRGEAPFEVGGDAFNARFDTIIPIDGYGNPDVVLGALRQVCTNGMVAFGRIFSSKIPGGSNDDGCIERIVQTIEGYGNDEGYDALRRRLDGATKSFASVAECSDMSKAVMRALGANGRDNAKTKELIDRFDRIAGNPTMMYGLVSATSVGRKRLQTLPSRATVYDLINFGTEVATHHVPNETQARQVHGVVGSMISGEFDLEGSARDGKDHIDVWLDQEEGNEIEKRQELLAEVEAGSIDD